MELLAAIVAHLGLLVFSLLIGGLMGVLAYWMLRPEAF